MRANVADLLVVAMPIAASPISGAHSETDLIESAQEP